VWNDILRHMEIGLTASQPYLFPDIELWGGAIHRTHTTATAFPYRSAIYNVGVLLMIPVNETNATGVFEQESMKVNQWWYKIDQYLTGSYVNYPTISLLDHEDQNNYAKVFWGENLPRLVKIKQRYDPGNVFRFPMSVPLQL
jgi:FAD/FMN-containing dehydrogenase